MIAVLLGLAISAPVDLQSALKVEADRTGKPIALLIDDPSVLEQPAADFDAAVRALRGKVVTSENGTVILTPTIEQSLRKASPPAVNIDFKHIRFLYGLLGHMGLTRVGQMVQNHEKIPLSELSDQLVEELDGIMNLSGTGADIRKAELSFYMHPKLSLYEGQTYYGINLAESPEGVVMRHPHPVYEKTGSETKIDLTKVRMVMREARGANGAAIPLSEFIRPFAGSHLAGGLQDSLIWAYAPDGEFLPQDRLWLAAQASGLVWRHDKTDSHICLHVGPDRLSRLMPAEEMIDVMHWLGRMPTAIEPHAFRGGSFLVSELDDESRSALWGAARMGLPEPQSTGVRALLDDDSKFKSLRGELSLQGMITVELSGATIGHSFSIR